jgi:hypothetical protein
MDTVETLVGKYAAYYLDGNCCSGYGQIIGISYFGFIEIDEYPGGFKKTAVDIIGVKVFETMKEASDCYHEDDEKREELFRKEFIELHS